MYRQIIREEAAKIGHLGINTRWVEGWIRLAHGTLDHLSRAEFRAEIRIAADCIAHSSTSENESLAQSYGLYEKKCCWCDDIAVAVVHGDYACWTHKAKYEPKEA